MKDDTIIPLPKTKCNLRQPKPQAKVQDQLELKQLLKPQPITRIRKTKLKIQINHEEQPEKIN